MRWKRLVGPLVLLAVYLGVGWLGDARAASFSDVGGKVATLRVMGERDSWEPDVGYWAAAADPEAVHHPLRHTVPRGDRYVQITSLPLVEAARPLWAIGGARAILLLPALGAVLAAVAAGWLARLVDPASDGRLAFWVTGLASPVAFYATDFWEHAPAVGVALLAVALALSADRVPVAALAGATAALGVVLRSEVALVLASLVVVAAFIPEERRRWTRRPALLVAAVAGGVAVLAASQLVERSLLGPGGSRAARSSGLVEGAGSVVATRLRDAVLTGFGIFQNEHPLSLLLGAVVAVGILCLALGAVRPGTSPLLVWLGGGVAIALLVVRGALGLGFVPGLLPASAVAAAGLFGARTSREHLLLGGGLLALPAIWLLQWPGEQAPQWGGRYLLVSGALLVVVGANAIDRAGMRRAPAVALLAVAAAVTWYGLAWHVDRTREVARTVEALLDVADGRVVVATDINLGREAGWWYGERRWLTADGEEALPDALAVAARSGVASVELVLAGDAVEAPDAIGEWRRSGGVRTVDHQGDDLLVVTYER
ncbi:MAG: hypothetical protein IPM45_17500 [Acidimicrobiales bacterium]|nr:hypothetical protein [Acidimicrobiales bacterium]